jgi:hypothetical protein
VPEPDPDLTARYLAATQDLAVAGGDAIAAAWDELGSWDDADIARLEGAALPAWEVFAQEAAAVSAGYLAVALNQTPVAATNLVVPDWRGPFTWYWRALGNDAGQGAALQAGRDRAIAAGHKAVTSTARRVGDQVDGVVGWRRTLGGDSCQWCITVAGQRYRTAESADFGHDHCNCGVTPILA